MMEATKAQTDRLKKAARAQERDKDESHGPELLEEVAGLKDVKVGQ